MEILDGFLNLESAKLLAKLMRDKGYITTVIDGYKIKTDIGIKKTWAIMAHKLK